MENISARRVSFLKVSEEMLEFPRPDNDILGPTRRLSLGTLTGSVAVIGQVPVATCYS